MVIDKVAPGIYMNYASTRPVKSKRVTGKLIKYLEENSHISGGRNFEGLDEGGLIHQARKTTARFFGAPPGAQVIFTPGITLSLNMILGGLLQPGDHVLTTGVEHNAVARPLWALQKKGIIEVDFLPASPRGDFDPSLIKKHIRSNTRLLVMTHASNVLGTILPWEASFAEAKQYGLFTLLDTAQTAGCFPLVMNENIDALAFTGHKGIGGLAGTGGFVLQAGAAPRIAPWLCGGTGSASHSLDQPEFLPDKFESGTANTLGIVSLAEGMEEIMERGTDAIREREKTLTRRFLEGLRTIPGLEVYGPGDAEKSAPLVSINAPQDSPWFDNALLARKLYDDYRIITRCGLHCSPLAHQSAGTFPRGTLRFSFGFETTVEEIDIAVKALEESLGK
jgi:cysteine desulfurase family protein